MMGFWPFFSGHKRGAKAVPSVNPAPYALLSRYPNGKAASISWLEDHERLELMKSLLLPQLEHLVVDSARVIIANDRRVDLQGTIDSASGEAWAKAENLEWAKAWQKATPLST